MKRIADRSTRGRTRRAFSLIEVAVAIAIISLGLVALLTAIQAGTDSNDMGRNLTRAAFLAQEIRVWTLKLPFSDPDPGDQGNPPGPDGSDPQVFVDDLDDLMGVTYDPPRDGAGSPIANMVGWSQTITITWRDPDSLTTIVPAGSTDAVVVQLDIACRGQTILTTSWIVVRRQE